MGESTLLQTAIAAVVTIAAGVLTFLHFVGWAMAASHPGLVSDVLILQRVIATLCSGLASLIVLVAGFRRIPAARMSFLLASACASLACGVALVFRDSREWDLASLVLAGLSIAFLGSTWRWSAAAQPAVATDGVSPRS
jgi:hypothetical protein